MQRMLPPSLFLGLALLGVAVGTVWPIVGPMTWPIRVLAVPVAAAGAMLTLRPARRFARDGANIVTFRDPTALIEDGAFARTRNPMYLGFALLAAVAIGIGTLSVWLAPLCFALVCDRWYIRYEERRMEHVFGSGYLAYRARVRRWL